MNDSRKDEAPLEAEQRNRGKWRGGETILPEDVASGHTLPESERDRATSGSAPGKAGAAAPSIVPPPD